MAYEAALTALSDPTRRLVFERVLAAPRPVAAIAEGLPVSRPAVSQHLKVLKGAGLITERRDGTRRLYAANPQALGELRAAIEAMWHEALSGVGAQLDKQRERMKISEFPVPPIVKTVTVRCTPERAFTLFAEDFARWWPLSRVHTGPDPVDCAIEPRVGGRVYERASDGAETLWGTVLAYDPPHRLAFSWVVQLSAVQAQLVDIRFTPEEHGTKVELTHSGWEKLGDAAASLRERYDRGWGTVFERHFADYANTAI